MHKLAPVTVPLGFLLVAAGKIARRVDVEWLGHYMTRRGTRRTLPARVSPMLTRVPWQMLSGVSRWEEPAYLEENRNTNIRKHLFYAVGKYRKRLDRRGGVHVLDYYTFYPTCEHDNIHGRGCECKHKTWNPICLLNWTGHLRVKLPDIDWRLRRGENTEVRLEVFRDWHHFPGHAAEEMVTFVRLVVDTVDGAFEHLGKPFYTVAHVTNAVVG